MDKEFLEGLQLAPETVAAILQEQEKQTQAHEKQIAQLRLEQAVESAVHRFGGRNVKAISALLDLTAIGESQDMGGALEEALKTLKQENDWLFYSQTPPPYAPFTGGTQAPVAKVTTLAGALRERMKK